MDYPFRGSQFSRGDKVRVKKDSVQYFKLPYESETETQQRVRELTVDNAIIREVDNAPEGAPYTDSYSYQLVTIREWGGVALYASDHFELV